MSDEKSHEHPFFHWQTADDMEYKLLKANAADNRSHPTMAESAFWQMAKGSGLGEACRRQYVIGNYIVDFFFRKSMLIVEIDGEYHFSEDQQSQDAIRQADLERMGYRVLRFRNEEVILDIESVKRIVKQHFK